MERLLATVALGDKRLDKRCNQLLEQFVKKPATSIPQACSSWKQTKAAYRFFTNEAVLPEEIMHAHYAETKERINHTEGLILVAQDTTDCDYTTHKKTDGLGYLQGRQLFGIKVHSALAMTEAGTPLGLVEQKRWIRDVSLLGKLPANPLAKGLSSESQRWLETVQVVAHRIPREKTVIIIGDREADIRDLFTTQRERNIHLLVRAKHNRHLGHGQKRLFEKVRLTKAAGTLTVNVQRTPQRKARKAVLQVSYTRVTLSAPERQERVALWAVAAEEIDPPGKEKPIRWVLLTTVPVVQYAQAVRVIGWYVKRWIIERFHYTLKSGCRIEELQLHEERRLERAIALFSIVAWRLLWMTYEAREHPSESYIAIMTGEEWEVLCRVTHSKQQTPQTIQEAIRMMAKLGGFLARKGDKDPGVKTLWIGLRRFTDMMTAWYLFKEKDVGKG